MSNSLPRVPVRLLEHNDELLKTQEGLAGQRQGATDFSEDQGYAQISGITATYRTPPDRMIGNIFFRRYLDGQLDIRYAVEKVTDAIHRVKNSGGVDQLNSEEKCALSIVFPLQFSYMDSGMHAAISAVQLKISLVEIAQIRMAVATQLQEELNYNAGRGGGSTAGRGQSFS